MLQHAARALAAFGNRAFLAITAKAAVATLIGLALAGWAVHAGLQAWFGDAWGDWGGLASGVMIALAGVLLVLPVGGLVVGFLAEDAIRAVEIREYPTNVGTHSLPPWQAVSTGTRFMARVVLLNVLALPVYLFAPGLNIAVFLLLNGTLAGREFFEMVALRHGGPDQMRALRKRHGWRVFTAGMVIALAFAVPVLNILAPLFGAAMMVHLFQELSRTSGVRTEDRREDSPS